jgi:predicted methyltransferase
MTQQFLLATVLAASSMILACSQSEPEATPAPEPAAEPAAAPEPAADLRSMLASDARSAEDQARDAGRKPADVVEFLGIEPGMSVIDVIAAGGYYTEVLSLAVGPEGSVVAHNPAFVLEFREGANEKAISARLADNRLPNVTRLNREFEELSADDGPFDAAITALNFHDLYNGRSPEDALAVLKIIYSMLKSGGTFGIIDHAGVADADNAELHRIEVAKVIETATAAGFVVDGQSGILSNSDDDHTQGVFAEGLRGNTDRFLLKLSKPAE